MPETQVVLRNSEEESLYGRCPDGIRRWYSGGEEEVVSKQGTLSSARSLGRPWEGTSRKRKRITGELSNETHLRSGENKNERQRVSFASATRSGAPWESWEDRLLLENVREESLLEKAQKLGRTYRAVESRRRDLLRRIDEQRQSDSEKL